MRDIKKFLPMTANLVSAVKKITKVRMIKNDKNLR